MSTSVLSVNDLLRQCAGRPVRTSLFDPAFRDRLGRYPGVLAGVFSDFLVVDCLDVPLRVPVGTQATLELVREGIYHWCHSTVQLGIADQPNRLHLSWPEKVQSVQSRVAPRVDTYVPVHYSTEGAPRHSQGVIVNISAGGAALQGNTSLAPGVIIHLVFALGTGLFFEEIRAEVLRVTKNRSGGWTAGLQFLNLTPVQEERLVQWVTRPE